MAVSRLSPVSLGYIFMLKMISRLLITAGMIMLVFGADRLVLTHFQQEKALKEAKQISSEHDGTEKEDIDLGIQYSEMEEGDTIGLLYIPRLDREISIISGTGEDELAKGVGHYSSTALLGKKDQILLSGHRDTVFRQFGELENGDEIQLKMEGETFVYEIYDTEIVGADDRSIIQPTAPDEVLTLSTCYPFSYIGNAPDRYIVYAK